MERAKRAERRRLILWIMKKKIIPEKMRSLRPHRIPSPLMQGRKVRWLVPRCRRSLGIAFGSETMVNALGVTKMVVAARNG